MVINKIDRTDARPAEVLNEIYDLFIDLDATEEQLDFPVLYTNARTGIARTELEDAGARRWSRSSRRSCDTVPAPRYDPEAPLQMLVTNLDYDDYVGRLAIGRIVNGRVAPGRACGRHAAATAGIEPVKVTVLYGYEGLKRVEIAEAGAGDIVAVAGIDEVKIGETIADLERPAPAAAHPASTSRRSRCCSRSTTRRFAGTGGQATSPRASSRSASTREPRDQRRHPGRGDRLARHASRSPAAASSSSPS